MTDQPKLTQTQSTFRRETGVQIDVRAPAERLWALLTDAPGFPRWNSTVTQIDGEIRDGQRIGLRVPNVDRVFKLTVSEFRPAEGMVWSDGFAPMFRGVRTYTLSRPEDGVTRFEMVERLSGLMLPLIGGSLPDFGPPFEQYARDLKKEAERSQS